MTGHRLDRDRRCSELLDRDPPALERRYIEPDGITLRECRARRGAQLDKPPEHVVERATKRTDAMQRRDVAIERVAQLG